MIVDISEEERQVILLALAKLCEERPGWDHMLSLTASKFEGEEMYLEFKAIHDIDQFDADLFGGHLI